MSIRFYMFIVTIFLLTGCGNSNNSNNFNIANNSNADATYTITFQANWNNSNFTTNFPSTSNPHFSGLIGTTHNDSIVFWNDTIKASTGVKNVAELGDKSAFITEINTAKANKSAEYILNDNKGAAIQGVGKTSLQFKINQTHSLVTLISMVAPSPDWFVGVHDLELYNNINSEWIPSATINLEVYDAGTDSGTTFSAANIATNPAVSITLLTSEPADTDFEQGVHRVTGDFIGTFTFVLE